MKVSLASALLGALLTAVLVEAIPPLPKRDVDLRFPYTGPEVPIADVGATFPPEDCSASEEVETLVWGRLRRIGGALPGQYTYYLSQLESETWTSVGIWGSCE